VVGEADNVRDAVALIKTKPADVMFLDINMPAVSGVQLAEGLKTHPQPPAVIFVTAYTQYAVKAFELDALDYLVKPVETGRLEKALEKLRQYLAAEQLDAAAACDGDRVATNRFMVDRAGKKQLIPIPDILYAVAKDDYSYLFTAEERYISNTSLTKIEEQLEGQGFFRVHRRSLVNLSKVDTLSSQAGGTLLLTLRGSDEEISVSRRRASALKTALRSV
jgi:two-component system response regulator LytT